MARLLLLFLGLALNLVTVDSKTYTQHSMAIMHRDQTNAV